MKKRERRSPSTRRRTRPTARLEKCPTGITGFDQITGGGLPKGRPTLICGSAGCGKTLFAMEFLVRGARDYREPGVFISFEETAEDLAKNVASLGFDVKGLSAKGLLAIDEVRIERSQIEETGDFNLDGLFIRLNDAIQTTRAKRVVLDTIESLFSGFSNAGILRAELRRLFQWLRDKGVTAIITAERGEGSLTRHGLEEYVSDCVILLDHRVNDQLSTRRLRVVKYRGSTHGTNEYPFLLEETGISVLPITSIGLSHPVTDERVSTGIPRLDTMLGGGGYYRGSTVLVSGNAGMGKTSLAAVFADATCRRGERCVYFSMEESAEQIARNMGSIGIDLEQWRKRGRLHFHSERPSSFGLEHHLLAMHRLCLMHEPHAVVLDPVSAFSFMGSVHDVNRMLSRFVDFLKGRKTTLLLTSLTSGDAVAESTESRISSIVDSWLLLSSIESAGERNRGLYVLKSRGMAHSNQIREFLLTPRGIELQDVYIGMEGVLTGTARLRQEAMEKAASAARLEDLRSKKQALEQNRKELQQRIAAMKGEFMKQQEEMSRLISETELSERNLQEMRSQVALSRHADKSGATSPGRRLRR